MAGGPQLGENFVDRHVGTDRAAQQSMLATVGWSSVDDLMGAAVPGAVRSSPSGADSSIPPAASERQTLRELRALAGRNRVRRSMIGLGYYGTVTPAVIQRNVIENPAWYTAYTPYQPEISQGRLEALITFQTVVEDLTGLAVANASMLDEATAVVEGMLLARRASGSRSARFLVDRDAHPQTRALLAHRAEALGIELIDVDPSAESDPGEVFGALVQYPGSSGRLVDPSTLIERVHAGGGLVVAATDLLALALLRPPGELGADIAVGSSQRFGVPMGMGGPHAGFLAVRAGLERQLPGRLVGVSRDADGAPAYRLALQTREQHIRREKATSNICTAQVLLAVAAAMYAVYHGPRGIRRIAHETNRAASTLADVLLSGGVELGAETFFDTLSVRVPERAAEVVAAAAADGVLIWQRDDDTVQLSCDETTTDSDLLVVARAILGEAAPVELPFKPLMRPIPPELIRQTPYLEHPVFSSHHSETSMLRYLRWLADKDYALDRGMIPLGSCTMKLNAATEMAAITWPEFADLHPFAPAEDVAGSLELIEQLQGWLAELTGYDAVSVQPNAGSQGELAGLLAIRAYHLSRDDTGRTVCLIPASAHGTNAASAVLAGMRVVVVATDAEGNVDHDDLAAKIDEHADTIAALMITYPSTHGVYEVGVRAVCDAVHAAGGQVYIDGANLNALLGHGRFGDLGGDVSHLNLHKTFCIPHGGGGPGVGPVAAKAHLAPFLPGHPMAQRDLVAGRDASTLPAHARIISAAPFGSPSILPISWAYVRMMGLRGLTAATGAAVLSANYLARRLGESFPVLYTGNQGLVAHECILDVRPLSARTGITVDDVAKRLVDYGFHAPTMSFPVAGTLMVEPTESEDLAELDRFVAAMEAIAGEAEAVARGEWPADDNPLVNAPHPATQLVGEWTHPYSRERAVYPLASIRQAKYWPPVARVDNAYGDRNLVCACPPVEAFV